MENLASAKFPSSPSHTRLACRRCSVPRAEASLRIKSTGRRWRRCLSHNGRAAVLETPYTRPSSAATRFKPTKIPARSSKESSNQRTGYGSLTQLSSSVTTIGLLVVSVAQQSKQWLKAAARRKREGGKLWYVILCSSLPSNMELEQAAFQQLNVQMETSSKWCPSSVHTGTSTIQYSHPHIIGLSAPSASLQMTPS